MSSRLSGVGAWLLYIVVTGMMIFILAPLLIVVAMSVSDSYFVSFPPMASR